MVTSTEIDPNVQLAEELSNFYADPLGFVMFAYPWGEPGPLAAYDGPDDNQREFLVSLGQEVRDRGFDGINPVMPILMAETSGHGTGKAHPTNMLLNTPDGMREWGSVQVGESLFGPHGSVNVLARHDRGTMPMYRVTFDDGSSTLVGADHIWAVRGRQQRRYGLEPHVLMTTLQICDAGVKRSNGMTDCRQWEIPTTQPVEMQANEVPVPAYALGVWLGDGGRRSARFTSMDSEVVERVRATGETVNANRKVETSRATAYGIAMLGERLRKLQLFDKYSYQKSVPSSYLQNSIQVRSEMLRGLMDTDGEVDNNGSASFSSTSMALASNVVWLARSLGGKAKCQPTIKLPFYDGPDGVKLQGRPSYRVTVSMPSGFVLFHIQRKQTRLRTLKQDRYLSRWIDSIDYVGDQDSMCVTVDDPDGLYLANDFIVTHNSAMGAWLTDWILSTRPFSMGTVTAGTYKQLEERTWAAIQFWTKLCITAHWFDIQAAGIYHKQYPDTWKVAVQSCKEENRQSFAGQHAANSTSWYLMDECSEVPDGVCETALGGMTDGEPMMFAWGQPVRNTGYFYRINFGDLAPRWNHRRVDSRTSKFTNKQLLDQWIQDYGIDSDHCKVRILGLPPSASELQYIDKARVDAAKGRQCFAMADEPLIAGFDVSGGGKAWNVIRFRKGLNGNPEGMTPVRIPGEHDPDRSQRVGICAELLREKRLGKHIAAMFIDSAFGAVIVSRLRALGFQNVFEVNFGGASPDQHCLNMRAYMWSKCKEWLLLGGLPNDNNLCQQLSLPGYHINNSGKLVIESKADIQGRGEASPDDADALCLTWAQSVAIPKRPVQNYSGGAHTAWS